MTILSQVQSLRRAYLEGINTTILARNTKIKAATLASRVNEGWKGGFPITGADVGGATSMWIMEHWAEQLPGSLGALGTGQRSGSTYEGLLENFLNDGFDALAKAGVQDAERLSATRGGTGEEFDQYTHLADINAALRGSDELRALFGRNYGVRPDVLIARRRIDPADLGGRGNEPIALYTPFFGDAKYAVNRVPRGRTVIPEAPILQAIVSCKFTLRSDRAQNVRPEANSAIKWRKGRLPSIVAITAEPMVGRLESLALGTGEIDCVYHSALPELDAAMVTAGAKGLEQLRELVRTRRLRDVSDLLFDVML